MTPPRVPTYAMCRWLLIPVVAAHNLEEWIMVPRYGSIAPALQNHAAELFATPPLLVLQTAWLLVTLVPALVVLFAARADRSPFRDGLVCLVASMYLANAFVPHLLEFAMSRAYAPGLVTASLVVLPFGIVLMRQGLREQYLSGRQLAAVVAAGFLALPVVIASSFAISSAFAAMFGWVA
ncbi:MAG: HXXEE domain-containing protein [Usitatibacteraceae bacterium]